MDEARPRIAVSSWVPACPEMEVCPGSSRETPRPGPYRRDDKLRATHAPAHGP